MSSGTQLDVDRVSFTIPGHVPSAANLREHWRTRHARTKRQRLVSNVIARAYVGPSHGQALLATGGTVMLTRLAPRPLDSDNLASSLKAHRDGIADALGVDDGDQRIQWVYAQAKCLKGQAAVAVIIGAGRRGA